MKTKQQLSTVRLLSLRGTRSREVIAHEMRKRGHATDAKAIWRYETGRSQPRTRILSDYAEVLGVTVEELFDDDEEDDSLSTDDILEALAPLARLLQKAARR